jgi:ABC-type transporter Mla subunit MlaD
MDHDEHLRQHDEQIQHLVALNVKMVEAIARIDVTLDRLATNLEVVTALLQRQRDDEHHNGA